MSHFSSISTEIKDLEACKKALENMGLALEKKGECRYYFGTEVMENVVKLPGRYDMALENMDGTYNIHADFYGGDVEKTIGYRGCALLKRYGIEMLKKTAKKMHFSIIKEKPNVFKVRDSKDSNGGYMIVTFNEDGSLQFTPKGIKGKNCTKFLALEDSIGKADKREFLPEYYAAERENIRTNNSKERIKLGGY